MASVARLCVVYDSSYTKTLLALLRTLHHIRYFNVVLLHPNIHTWINDHRYQVGEEVIPVAYTIKAGVPTGNEANLVIVSIPL